MDDPGVVGDASKPPQFAQTDGLWCPYHVLGRTLLRWTSRQRSPRYLVPAYVSLPGWEVAQRVGANFFPLKRKGNLRKNIHLFSHFNMSVRVLFQRHHCKLLNRKQSLFNVEITGFIWHNTVWIRGSTSKSRACFRFWHCNACCTWDTVWIMAISKSRACLFVFASCANGAPGLANTESTLLISGKTGRLKVCLQTFLQL